MQRKEGPPAEGAGKTRRTKQSIAVELVVVAVAIALAVWVVHADSSWMERHASAARCIRDTDTVKAGSLLRALVTVVAAVLLLVVRPLLWRRVARYGITVGGVARNAAAVVLALVAAEVYLRKPWSTPAAPPALSCDFCPPVVASDATMWELAPSSDFTWHAGGREIVYSVDAEGNRARTSRTEPDHARPTIFVAGESVAMGMGVPYEESFGALIEDETGVQVVDCGVHGYALDQAYLRATEAMFGYQRPVALVMVVLSEFAERAEVETRPRLRVDADGELQPTPPTPQWVLDIRLRQRFRDAYHSDAEADDLRALVRATAALAHTRGAYPLFVTTNFAAPCQDVRGHPPWLFRTLFEDQGLARVNVDLPASQRVGQGDDHPGPRSHRQIADAVLRALRDARVL